MPPSRLDSDGHEGARRGKRGRRDSRLISREVLERFRRERIYLAVAELAHDEGPAALITTRILKRGRMSRNTFYDLFRDKAECLDLACEYSRDRLVAPLEEIRPDAANEPERLDRAISALLEAVSEEPSVAELCLVHAPSISARGRDLGVEAIVEAMIGAVVEGEDQDPGRSGLGEFVTATVVSIVVSRVRRGEAAQLGELRGELTELAAWLWNEPAGPVGAP